jgi:hypothetical protein
MGRLDPHSPTVGVEAAAAVLAHLEDALGASTYLDSAGLVLGDDGDVFHLVHDCRLAVAARLGVEIEPDLRQPGETFDEFDARLDAAIERDRRIDEQIERAQRERDDEERR